MSHINDVILFRVRWRRPIQPSGFNLRLLQMGLILISIDRLSRLENFTPKHNPEFYRENYPKIISTASKIAANFEREVNTQKCMLKSSSLKSTLKIRLNSEKFQNFHFQAEVVIFE